MIWWNHNSLSHGKVNPGINVSAEWSYATAIPVPRIPVHGQGGKDLAEG